MRRLIIGMTGSTGAIFGVRMLEALKDSGIESHLIISKWAQRTLEHETRYTTRPDGRLVATGSAVAHAGDVDGLLPPGDIHRVTNAGTDLAISLHAYGADLSLAGSSIRRRYDDALVG